MHANTITCMECEGAGEFSSDMSDGSTLYRGRCEHCSGRGWVEDDTLEEHLDNMVEIQMTAYPDGWPEQDKREMAERHLGLGGFNV